MRIASPVRRAITVSALVAGMALGQAVWAAEPTMNDIYAKAQAGQLAEAQTMVQQVLVAHPKSAKAYYVQAELFARQGLLDKARQALATAEQLAPGLPFASAHSVQELRSQLQGTTRVQNTPATTPSPVNTAPTSTNKSNSWLLPVGLTALFFIGVILWMRSRRPQVQTVASYSGTGYDSGAGMNTPAPYPAAPQPGYGYNPHYNNGYGAPAQPSMGSRIAGGLATGLAVGAGVVAAEAIGRSIMGGNEAHAAPAPHLDPVPTYAPDVNADMGGNNFGINDASWDSGGSGGGSDWE
ncbi:tetratricopeptide repeat protein [Curvibacter sp. CHRR-16]|uniref:tetratricopeptide repeat protein n=1 Tax=Curvibacter sp. CHRR-16 TaxID=2835872 RepID=UPI001BD9C466|nr:tetratricopeptide repeat protein [Curvibacter sp. CHRR-16]MBT0571493.1 tetratricopeptide repeat protein [Curvibacter sp. CHRR-16]